MSRRLFAVAFVILLAVACTTAPEQPRRGEAEGEGRDKGEVAELFSHKCNACHKAHRVRSEKRSPGEWKTTVMRMKNKDGSNITEKQAEAIIDYLVRHHVKR